MTHAADIHIGTSGWHYNHWIGPFYPPASKGFLAHYARHFSTVEINNTFHRLPTRHAVLQWRDGSPSGFVFATKGSRFITHMKKLGGPETSIQRYFDLIELLGDKLGPIVVQLPPSWHLNLDRLADFLKALPKRWQYAFEFGDESWFDPRAYELRSSGYRRDAQPRLRAGTPICSMTSLSTAAQAMASSSCSGVASIVRDGGDPGIVQVADVFDVLRREAAGPVLGHLHGVGPGSEVACDSSSDGFPLLSRSAWDRALTHVNRVSWNICHDRFGPLLTSTRRVK